MADTIKDGSGSGRLANVDAHGRLETSALHISHAYFHSKVLQNCYAIYTKHIQQTGATGEYMLGLTYTGDKHFIISDIHASTDEAAGSTLLEVYENSTTIGGGVAAEVRNLNLGSLLPLSCTALGSNAGATPVTVGAAGGHLWHIAQKEEGNLDKHTQEALVMTTGTNLLFKVQATTAGTSIRLTVIGFEEDTDFA